MSDRASYNQGFMVGDQVMMCSEFKSMKPPVDSYHNGIVIGISGSGVKVKMPSGRVIFSADRYWHLLSQPRWSEK